MAGWRQHIPGLRSESRWKQIAAGIGYALIAAAIIGGIAAASAFWFIFGLIALGFVALGANVGGLRSRMPVLGSTNRWAAIGGWAGLVLVSLIILGLAAPAKKEQSSQALRAASLATMPSARTALGATTTTSPASGLASSPTPAASPAHTASPTPTPTPSPSPSPTPSPTPTPAPTPPPPPKPRPLASPAYVVNTMPVGCHAAPDATAAIIAQRDPGTVETMDQAITVADGTWQREATQQCWVRTDPGPVRVFAALADAEGFAVTLRPTPTPAPPPPRTAPAPAPAPATAVPAPAPSGATAVCRDGTLSFSAHRRGTCSHHGGVAQWLRNDVPP